MDLTNIASYKNAKVTVMGLGSYKEGSGISAAKWLLKQGAQIVVTDQKSEEELAEAKKSLLVAYEKYHFDHKPVFVLGKHREEDFTDVDLIVKNPGVPGESVFLEKARAHGLPIESDISIFLRLYPHPVYGVTGTRGKSTTTALWGEMLKTIDEKAVVAGNIQHSPLEHLAELLERGEPTPVVLELSSWMLEHFPFVPKGIEVAIMTNMYEDHLNRYVSFAEYQKAKENIFLRQAENQKAILNYDHPLVREMASRIKAKKFWFSLRPFFEGQYGVCVIENKIVSTINGLEREICSVEELALAGEHNLQNVLAATAGALLTGVPVEKIATVLKKFSGLPNRQEIIAEKNGVTFVNDTTATSPDGVVEALRHFGKDKNIILLAGGSSKKLSFAKLGPLIERTCKFVVLFDGTATAELLTSIRPKVAIEKVYSMSEAVAIAVKNASVGDIVLLSPGAASFGMFKNEFERGEQFKKEVGKLN